MVHDSNKVGEDEVIERRFQPLMTHFQFKPTMEFFVGGVPHDYQVCFVERLKSILINFSSFIIKFKLNTCYKLTPFQTSQRCHCHWSIYSSPSICLREIFQGASGKCCWTNIRSECSTFRNFSPPRLRRVMDLLSGWLVQIFQIFRMFPMFQMFAMFQMFPMFQMFASSLTFCDDWWLQLS